MLIMKVAWLSYHTKNFRIYKQSNKKCKNLIFSREQTALDLSRIPERVGWNKRWSRKGNSFSPNSLFIMSITGVEDIDFLILRNQSLKEDAPALNLVCKKWKMNHGHVRNTKKASYSNYLALHGNLKTLKWARKNNCPWDCKTFGNAVKSGNFKLVKWLKKNSCRRPSPVKLSEMVDDTVKSGNLENLQWLHNNHLFSSYSDSLSIAAREGKLDIIKWLVNAGAPLTKFIFEEAACSENLQVMKWLKRKKCPWDRYTFANAASVGNLQVLEWLLQNGCPWDSDTFTSAAIAGNLQTMEWLFKNNCPYESRNHCLHSPLQDDVKNWLGQHNL